MSLKRRLGKLEASSRSGRHLWLFARSLEAVTTGDPAEIAATRAEVNAEPDETPLLRFCRALLAPEIVAPYLRAEHEA